MNRIPNGTREQPAPCAYYSQSLGHDSDLGLSRNAEPQRLRFVEWQRRGEIPPGLAPATLARGYRQAFGGRDPHRAPKRTQTRAYNRQELTAALAALRSAPPAPPPPDPRPQTKAPPRLLALLWGLGLQALELPSTRMLLSHQAELVALRQASPLQAELAVTSCWLAMVSNRLPLIEAALALAWGEPIAVILRGVER
jgi:hypothetical protein